MKIYFNRRPVQGPWGGGSKVLSSIVEECNNRNHEVFFEEEIFTRNDIDVIFCMDPRPTQKLSFKDLVDYKNKFGAKLVQRIGDLGTHGKPELLDLLKDTTQLSDVLIFPSNWAKNYLNPPPIKRSHVILNAPLKEFVKYKNYEKQSEYLNSTPIKVVTHHWSNNFNKGFDIYKKFDQYCSTTNKFKFTYIGRAPSGVSFTNEIPPLNIEGLVEELPQHHVYLTASKQEAGANHVLEALGLNIPVLYHIDGGSIVEYCKNYGYVYESVEELISILEDSISLIRDTFLYMDYKRDSKIMANEYVDLFEGLQ